MLDYAGAWPLSRGENVKVAVLSSGVDATQPQLHGRVVPGTDLIEHTDGQSDCTGHGTEVAGIIAAQADPNVGFRGVAPLATIVPVRVSDDEASGHTAGIPGLAAGIRFAVTSGARVILVPITVYQPDPALQDAVAEASAKDVLVVAAVGNDAGTSGTNRTPYPAAYPSVIGVAAIDQTGAAPADVGHGPFVDLAAPGVRVATTQRGGGLVVADGTGLAAAFVAGAAALVRSRWPDLRVDQVITRLTATATPAPGGPDSGRYGYGIVNPYAAVADQMAARPPAPLPGIAHDDATDQARAQTWAASARTTFLLTTLGVLLALAVIGLAVALPRGRRARWRSRLAPRPVPQVENEEPGPPVQLFADRER